MGAFDRVQLVPGIPLTRAYELSTAWQQLPPTPGGCYAVIIGHREGATETIYISTDDSGGGGLNRWELGPNQVSIGFECDDTDRIWLACDTGTPIAQVMIIRGQLKAIPGSGG